MGGFQTIIDKQTGLNPDFLFNEIAAEIRKLFGERKRCRCFHNKKTSINEKLILEEKG